MLTRSTPRAVMALALATLTTTACHGGRHTETFDWEGPISPGATLHVRNLNGEINVGRGQANAAVVHGTVTWTRAKASDVRFVTTRDGNDYYLCAVWGRGRCGPDGYRSSTGLGFLALFSLFHRSNNARVNIALEVPAGVSVDASTSNGDVSVRDATAPVTVHSTNGSVIAEGVGLIEAKTVNGNVNVAAGGPADSVRAATVNGVVTATVSPAFQGEIDAKTVNGRAAVSLPGAPSATGRSRSIDMTVGNGAGYIRLRTTNGNVSVGTAAASH